MNILYVLPFSHPAIAARLMLDHTIGALPVVDVGRLIGIVTETDLLHHFASLPA